MMYLTDFSAINIRIDGKQVYARIRLDGKYEPLTTIYQWDDKWKAQLLDNRLFNTKEDAMVAIDKCLVAFGGFEIVSMERAEKLRLLL